MHVINFSSISLWTVLISAFSFAVIAPIEGQNVFLDTQAEVDAFDPGTNLISGDLIINSQNGDSITNISNLSNIQYISGSLVIQSTKLTDLDAFSNLDSIGVDLQINLNPLLRHIDGFSNLTRIGEDVKINSNDILERISGLTGVSKIEGSLQIKSNQALLTLDGLQNIFAIVEGCDINNNDVLTSLQALATLTSVGTDFIININDSLKTLNGLENLILIGEDLYIRGQFLTNADGLSNLQNVGGNLDVYPTSLSDITGFSSLKSVGGSLEIHNNDLKKISGFPNLESVGGLIIVGNQSLVEITGFVNLIEVNGELGFYSNARLRSISGLSSVQVVGNLNLSLNHNLKNIDGLAGLTTISGNLDIQGTFLENLTGLSNLTNIGGEVILRNNISLGTVDGFSSLISIGGDLTITENAGLQNLDSLLNLTFIGGNLEIGGNHETLINLNGLESLSMINGDLFLSQGHLENIDGLKNLKSVGGSLLIEPNPISNLTGLGSLSSVGRDFTLSFLRNINHVDSLSDLKSIGGELTIYLTGLKNVDGLINLETIGSLDFNNNDSLTNINGLKNLKLVDGYFVLNHNPALSLCCSISDILSNPEIFQGPITIKQNAPGCNSESEVINSSGCGFIYVYNDYNVTCTRELEETGLKQRRIRIDPGSYILVTDDRGRIDISNLPVGSYIMEIDTSGPWETNCSPVRNFEITSQDSFPSIESFPLTSTQICSYPSVSLDMPFARPCFSNQMIYLQACNSILATDVIYDAYLLLTLDSILDIQSASHPFTQIGMNIYQFDLGDIYPDQCININIKTMVSCDAVLGQTVCITSELFPVDTCVYDYTQHTFTTPSNSCNEDYEGSHIIVTGHCLGDSISFEVSNVSDYDVRCYTPVRLYADFELLWKDSILLSSNEKRTFTVAADGKTYRVEADQHPDYISHSRPNATVERCGELINWIPGLINAFYLDDANPIVDISCTEISGSFDPNDKIGVPTGITDEQLILPNQSLEYRIRFQNTGTDTAFNVVILDTLDHDLNIFSVIPGVTSHPSTFRMYGPRVLEWKFANILLPDSTTNENASHGFVTFQVEQNRNLFNGTLLSNHAGIYFDFNEEVVTNNSWHMIDDQIQNVITPVSVTNQTRTYFNIFPNPTSRVVHLSTNSLTQNIVVDVFNIAGQTVYQNKFFASEIMEFELDDAGLYFLRVRIGDHVETLKVIVY